MGNLLICDVGNGRFFWGGGKWGRGVWLCWVAFRKVEVVTGCLSRGGSYKGGNDCKCTVEGRGGGEVSGKEKLVYCNSLMRIYACSFIP